MNIRKSPASAPDLVAAVSGELTPAERRIAEAVLAEPTLLAFGTVSDLASRIGTSRPTIVRFANKLGFEGYTQLQRHVRSDLSHRLARPSERIRHEQGNSPGARAAINNALASVFEAVDGERLGELTAPILRAERVWILSGETSQAGARKLHSGLSIVRPGVRLLDERTFGADACDVEPRDAAVVMDFFRYRRRVTEAARLLSQSAIGRVGGYLVRNRSAGRGPVRQLGAGRGHRRVVGGPRGPRPARPGDRPHRPHRGLVGGNEGFPTMSFSRSESK
jgi:DNA-binding MurR/RpiR family transcriptional regulator